MLTIFLVLVGGFVLGYFAACLLFIANGGK
jgi:hypothetical protein